MKRWVKYSRNVIIMFVITFCFFSVIMMFIVVGWPPASRIEINEFYGDDDNNDTAVDTIGIIITNAGDKKEEITAIDFSQMEKRWILKNLTFPIELPRYSMFKQLTFVAATDQDQITANDEIHVAIFLAREGTAPAIVIDNDDLQRENGHGFETKEHVLLGYYKEYPHEYYLYILTLSLVASLITNVVLNILFFGYLMIKQVRSTVRQREW